MPLSLAAIALPSLRGQPKDLNRERDADGFGNIKWGMTVAEAKAAFPGLREPERSELTSGAFEERLIQPVLMIGSVEMTVSIQTKTDSDLITRIVQTGIGAGLWLSTKSADLDGETEKVYPIDTSAPFLGRCDRRWARLEREAFAKYWPI